MRVFVAIPLDSETRDLLAQRIRAAVPVMPGRPVPPENWHLTLRFLGEIDEVALDRLNAALDEAPLGPRFPVRWGALGAFPRASRAGVLWIGMEGDGGDLHRLADRVDAALAVAGHPLEDRPFRPHLTISRMRPQVDVRSVVAAALPAGVAMEVDRVAVFQSRLGRGGASYRVVEEHRLDG
jgi:2'-5' RNA ligase